MATTWGTFKRSGIPIPVGFQGVEFGDVYFVDYGNGSDSNRGLTPGTAFKTYSKAYDKATSDQNDAILINGVTAVTETAMIGWTKNRIHTFGCNGPAPGAGYGSGARIVQGTTGVASDLANGQVTGVRNTWNGIKFENTSATTTCMYSWMEAGEYNRYNNCEFIKNALQTTDLTADLLMNGDSSQFYGCTLGTLTDPEHGGSGKERPCVLLTGGTVTGKKCRDGWFEKCRLLRNAAHVDVCHVYGPNATDVERSLIFKSCLFMNSVLATAAVANAINFAAAQTEGQVLAWDCARMNTTYVGGADLGIFQVGSVATDATTGIGIECSTP